MNELFAFVAGYLVCKYQDKILSFFKKEVVPNE